MSIEVPADWPERSWVEDTPIGHLETLATDAPSGTVPTRWAVASWESTREIASSALPGQVRHKTGLSVGTGKALVKRQQDDFPWKQRDVYDLSGSAAQILIAPEGSTKIPTGQFRVADTDGDLTTTGVTVDLEERQIQGRNKAPGVLGEQLVSWAQLADAVFDPAWWIAELADQMGYGVSLAPGTEDYRPILDVPLQGSLAPASPVNINFSTTENPLKWGVLDGRIALAMTGTTHQFVRYNIGKQLSSLYTVTYDFNDTFQMRWQNAANVGWVQLRTVEGIGGDPNVVEVGMLSNGINNVQNANTFVNLNLPVDPTRPAGLQVQVEFFLAGNNAWGSTRFRARRGAGSAWSAWTTHPMANQPGGMDDTFDIQLRPDDAATGGAQGMAARFSLMESGDPVLDPILQDRIWNNVSADQQGRLYLEPLFGTNQSPWLDPDKGVLTLMQEIAEAWQGALITDVYGDLRLMNRFSLTGVGTGTEIPVNIGTKFEDLPWVMNYADQADRLVLKYRPVVVRDWESTSDNIDIIWELDRVVPMYPGPNNIIFTLDYIYPVDLKLIPFVRKDNSNGQFHEWDAYRYNNGTGTHMDPGEMIQMRIDRITASTWSVYVLNRTGEPFHMVDNTGTPWLKIRSSYYFDQTQEAIVERGVASGEGENTLEVDVSNYVQNAADANTLADFLWGRVNRRAWRAKTINSVPDYRLDLGDVVAITHERTGVRSNALVTKVKLAGDPGQVTQLLDLALIPPTWEDFDEAWAAYQPNPPGSWVEFDALWGPPAPSFTWNDFDRTPTATTVAEIQEGM